MRSGGEAHNLEPRIMRITNRPNALLNLFSTPLKILFHFEVFQGNFEVRYLQSRQRNQGFPTQEPLYLLNLPRSQRALWKKAGKTWVLGYFLIRFQGGGENRLNTENHRTR